MRKIRKKRKRKTKKKRKKKKKTYRDKTIWIGSTLSTFFSSISVMFDRGANRTMEFEAVVDCFLWRKRGEGGRWWWWWWWW